LDGELSPDEQALVEQTLVESAEHRQLFDELRALRGSLQALPTHRLEHDLSQRVLRRAEQAMQREGSKPAGEANSKPSSVEAVASWALAKAPESQLITQSPISLANHLARFRAINLKCRNARGARNPLPFRRYFHPAAPLPGALAQRKTRPALSHPNQ